MRDCQKQYEKGKSTWKEISELPDGRKLGRKYGTWHLLDEEFDRVPIVGSDFFVDFDVIGILDRKDRYVIGITGPDTYRWAVGTVDSGVLKIESWTEMGDDNSTLRDPHTALAKLGEVGIIKSILGNTGVKFYRPE